MHLYVKPAVLTLCSKCKSRVLPYTVCQNCGHYKGREVIDILGKLTKKEKKQREKEMQKSEKQEKQESPITMETLSKKQ